ncbi:MAG: hypothetical protein MJZ34_02670 [Paludibacteraceae bacterium]|nr:hypothetical protein [Paludibacteraceae bacterium]
MESKRGMYMCVDHLKDGAWVFRNQDGDTFSCYGNGFVLGLWYEYRNGTLQRVEID